MTLHSNRSTRARARIAPLVAFSSALVAIAIGCATSNDDLRILGFEPGGDAGPSLPSFTAPEAGPPPEAGTPMCISYECPAPYATCLGTPGLCTTNLKTDLNNCGTCDKKCVVPDGGRLPNGAFSCMDGECYLQCPVGLGDCNGQIEDGCESILIEPENCGACGNACKEGEVCWEGACGCPPGWTQCGRGCTRLDSDKDNCSACGRKCTFADADGSSWPCGEGVIPHLYGPLCRDSSCILDCDEGHLDCNGDLCGDGCETYAARDPKNCGACGHACLPEQECQRGKCECADPALIFCSVGGGCVDLMKDPSNCGSCGNVCPGYQTNDNGWRGGFPICELGRCSYYCPPGRANCDGRIDNGCEVDLMVDPLNCGDCGVHCDLERGQPCAVGRCLTKPCDVPDAGGVF